MRRLLLLAIVFGFWWPPFMVGRWLGGRYSRALIILVTAPAWSLIWLWLLNSTLFVKPYVRHGPSDPGDADAYAQIGAMALAFFIVLPASFVVCWIGTPSHRWLYSTIRKYRVGISLVIFALIQVPLIALLFLR